MSTSIDAIRRDFEAFCERINVFTANIANSDRRKDSCEAAYEGLYKLFQRIRKEIKFGDLTNQERAVCHALREDLFLNGLLELRTVGTHIVSDTARKKGHIELRVPSDALAKIPCETSAGSLFSEEVFRLPNPSWITGINHRENLSEAKRRIERLLIRKTHS